MTRVEHHGFSEHEFEATRLFFEHFQIDQPRVPLLVPEFQNPLFLKLFCKGLHEAKFTAVPSGFRGGTRIFELFIDALDTKLRKPDLLDYGPKERTVRKAVNVLAQAMAERQRRWLHQDEAQELLNAVKPADGYEKSLFRHLLSEGMISEDRRYEEQEWHDVVRFTYERFSDHLIAKYLIETHLDPENPSLAFSEGQPLAYLIQDRMNCLENAGLLEAFAIQLPERIHRELIEVVPAIADEQVAREAVVESLMWRDPQSITEAIGQYIDEQIMPFSHTRELLLRVLLTIALHPDHPYNAQYLHSILLEQTLAERDAWWSIFLHEEHRERSIVDRLIDWAWSPTDKDYTHEDTLFLCGVTLSWFLTTSNRFVRDKATKALVNLFTRRIPILRRVMGQFLAVDDPYVLERLYAVAYGCAMRNTDDNEIAHLASDVYGWVFQDDTPPVHILLRDYARGVIEVALHRGIASEIDINKVRPPYHSEWPVDIPTEEELKPLYEYREGMSDEEIGQCMIGDSVMGSLMGDFARYVIGTDDQFFAWSSRRLRELSPPSRQEIYDEFVSSLNDQQHHSFKEWEAAHRAERAYHQSEMLHQIAQQLNIETSILPPEVDESSGVDFEESRATREQEFCELLNGEQRRIFVDWVIPYLSNPSPSEREHPFDLSLAQRWILRRVFELGWTKERFGHFDRWVHYNDMREAGKPERIGKKYQWIAYHEFLAHVSDNFEYVGKWSSDLPTDGYDGPWQDLYIRDIDPSWILPEVKDARYLQIDPKVWWLPIEYNSWCPEQDDHFWLQSNSDLPDIEAVITVTHPEDKTVWFNLNTFFIQKQPVPPGEERYRHPKREVWFKLSAVIVRQTDVDELLSWSNTRDLRRRNIPEYTPFYHVFFGELFWSSAYQYQYTPSQGREDWQQDELDGQVPVPFLVPAETYAQESTGFDCSIRDTISVQIPARWLADQMKLQWNGNEGKFIDATGSVVTFDPSVHTSGPGSLLFRRDSLLNHLHSHGYDILWVVVGEKQAIGPGFPDTSPGRLDFSGVYRLRDGAAEGTLKSTFVSWKD
jgi:hypothetical protein